MRGTCHRQSRQFSDSPRDNERSSPSSHDHHMESSPPPDGVGRWSQTRIMTNQPPRPEKSSPTRRVQPLCLSPDTLGSLRTPRLECRLATTTRITRTPDIVRLPHKEPDKLSLIILAFLCQARRTRLRLFSTSFPAGSWLCPGCLRLISSRACSLHSDSFAGWGT